MRKFTINLKEKTNIAHTCDAINIEWISEESCAVITYISPDNKTIKVVYPDGCNDTMKAVITCIDECEDCPPEIIIIKPCEEDADCPDCEFCSDEGICVSKCKPNEFCKDDSCVECDEHNPCPNNQECDNGKCVCPPGLILNSKGVCVECIGDEDCSNCNQCLTGTCTPRVCDGNQIVNPDTCRCVDCVNDLDCTEPNECCAGDLGVCKCCDGYIRDSSGDCVEEPECVFDSDCPVCEVCDGNGDCIPKVCPPGKECVNDQCLDPCDCDNPDCKANEICAPTGGGNCHCVKCSGPCDGNNDCGPGCYCDGGVCVKNPCLGACADGKDCGPGCGCDGNMCVPCGSIDCDDCDSVKGCECRDGDNCERAACFGPCDNENDCGEGCGCFQKECIRCEDLPCDDCRLTYGCKCINNTDCVPTDCRGTCDDGNDCGDDCGCLDERCVECNTISCANGGKCPKGCICNPNTGLCQKNPCSQAHCINGNDCGIGCGCNSDGDCVPCEYLDCGDDCDNVNGCECVGNDCVKEENPECDDQLTLEKNDYNCTLEAAYLSDSCCPCDDIGIGYEIQDVVEKPLSTDFKIEITLRKGDFIDKNNFLLNPMLSSTGIHNELPTSGIVEVVVEAELREVDQYGFFVPNGDTLINTYTRTLNVGGIDTGILIFENIAKPGAIVNSFTRSYKVVVNRVFARVSSNIKFDNNCNQSKSRERIMYFTELDNVYDGAFEVQKTFKNVTCRKPLMRFYKNITGQAKQSSIPTVNFFNVYAWAYSLDNTNGVEVDAYYRVSVDCGCADDKDFTCASTDFSKLFFSPSSNLEFEVKECGRKIKFLDDYTIECPAYFGVNRNIGFSLYLNGVVIPSSITTVNPNNNLVVYPSGTEFTLDEPAIDGVIHNIRIQVDGCGFNQWFVVPYDAPQGDLSFNKNHCDQDTNFIIDLDLSGGFGPFDVEITEDPGSGNNQVFYNASMNAGIHEISFAQINAGTGVFKLDIEDANGCTFSEIFEYTIMAVGDGYSISDFCSPKNMGIVAENTGFPYLFVQIPGYGTHKILNGQQKVIDLPKGTYAGVIVRPSLSGNFWDTDPACDDTKTINVGCCRGNDDNEVLVFVNGGNLDLIVQNNNSGDVSYEVIEMPSTSKGTIILNNDTAHTFTGLDPNEQHTIKAKSVDGNACPEDVIFTYDPGDECNAIEDSWTIESYCDGTDKKIKIKNPNMYPINIFIDSVQKENGVTGTIYTYDVNSQNTTVKVEHATNNNCSKTKVETTNCCLNITPIAVISESCGQSGGLTLKRFTFNNITSAEDQSGGNIPIVNGNQVEVNTAIVTSIYAEYVDSNGCQTDITITDMDCACLDAINSISWQYDDSTSLPGYDGQLTIYNPNNLTLIVGDMNDIRYSGNDTTIEVGLATGSYEIPVKITGAQYGNCTFIMKGDIFGSCDCNTSTNVQKFEIDYSDWSNHTGSGEAKRFTTYYVDPNSGNETWTIQSYKNNDINNFLYGTTTSNGGSYLGLENYLKGKFGGENVNIILDVLNSKFTIYIAECIDLEYVKIKASFDDAIVNNVSSNCVGNPF